MDVDGMVSGRQVFDIQFDFHTRRHIGQRGCPDALPRGAFDLYNYWLGRCFGHRVLRRARNEDRGCREGEYRWNFHNLPFQLALLLAINLFFRVLPGIIHKELVYTLLHVAIPATRQTRSRALLDAAKLVEPGPLGGYYGRRFSRPLQPALPSQALLITF